MLGVSASPSEGRSEAKEAGPARQRRDRSSAAAAPAPTPTPTPAFPLPFQSGERPPPAHSRRAKERGRDRKGDLRFGLTHRRSGF